MTFLKRVSSWIEAISSVTGRLAAILMAAIACIAFYEVVMRFLFRNPTGWTIEFVPWLMIWGGFIGGALALKEERHIRVDLLVRHLSLKAQRVLKVITGGIGLLFCSVLLVEGIKMVMQTKNLGTITPGIGIKVYIPQMCVPIGAGLLFIQFLRCLSEDIASLRSGDMKDEGNKS